MQNVSQKWKDNQKDVLVNESEIELSMRITDPDAYEDASASSDNVIYFAQTEDVVSGAEYSMTPTLTLEQNLWVLDGNGKVLDTDAYGTNRYISNHRCGLDKIFTDRPIISVSFSQVFTNLLQGITIVWSTLWEEYAEEFIVTAYNGEDVVATKTVTDNASTKSIVYMDIVNYDSITIEVVRWSLSHRRARIEEVVIGIDKAYTKSDLFSYSHSQSVNPLSTELPKVEINFAINNADNSYNPHNTDGLSKYLIERQEIKVRYGYKIDDNVEWIDGGRMYLSEWDAPQDGMTAEFKASGLLDFMRKTYYGGTYYPNGRSLYDLAVDVLTDADLPLNSDRSVKWQIDESLKDIYTVAPLPIDTHANCLQLIANAGGCVILQDRRGVLHIKKRNIKATNIFNFGSYTGITWANVVPNNKEVVMFLNALQPGIYKMSYTMALTSKASNGLDTDSGGIVVRFNDGTSIASRTKWGNTSVGTVLTRSFEIPLTFEKLSIGIRDVLLYGLGNDSVGKTGTADFSNMALSLSNPDYSVDYSNSYSKSNITLSKPIKDVAIGFYQYSVATDSTELYKGSINISGTKEIIVTYSGSATSVNATVSGGTLNNAVYYSNACKLTITASGDVTVTVTGKSLESAKTEISIYNSDSGETVSVDNMLITSIDRASVIGEWIRSYYNNRMTLSSSWRADPRLDALDIVDNENDYSTSKVLMTEVTYDYNGAFKGSGEGKVI